MSPNHIINHRELKRIFIQLNKSLFGLLFLANKVYFTNVQTFGSLLLAQMFKLFGYWYWEKNGLTHRNNVCIQIHELDANFFEDTRS